MPPTDSAAADLPILQLPDAAAWEAWLEAHHASSPGAWLRFGKKGGEVRTLSYAEAVEVALCYGWIDSQARSEGAASWLQRYTPRRARSIWSKVNRNRVQALMDAGRMRPAGLAEVERARADGRWERAYDPPATATVPDDLRAALDASPRAAEHFAALNATNRYQVLVHLQTARRAETRARRIAQLVEKLERDESIHP